MPECKRFDERVWMEFGKILLRHKGSEQQKEFLVACKSGKDDFLEYIGEHLLSQKDSVIDGDLIALQYRFTEREFLHPPKDTQERIWNTFKYLSREAKSHFGFWGYTIINMIEDDHIKPAYLAAKLNGADKTGAYVIDEAVNEKTNEKTTDECVRRILRSMCNPAPRGKRILFSDFYLGKAYWRWRWAKEMSEVIGLEFDKILNIFDEEYYATFAGKMHSGKSYIGSENVLGGLLLYLEAKKDDKKKNEKIGSEKLGKIIDKISHLSAWKGIEIQEPDLNKKEIEKISTTVLEEKPKEKSTKSPKD